MSNEQDLPSGRRIYELTKASMEIRESAMKGSSLCYELYVADFEEGADRFSRRLNDTDNRFFETVCSIGKDYRPPGERDPDEPSAHEIRMELKREVEGWDEHEYDEDRGMSFYEECREAEMEPEQEMEIE